MVHQPPDTRERRYVILPPRLDINRSTDFPEIDRGTAYRETVRNDEAIVTVEIDQILAVPLRRQVRNVAVPVEEVKGRIVIAKKVIVDDIIPDEVASAQRIEGRGHVAAVEVAVRRKLLEERKVALVHEQFEIARKLEIDLCGEEGCRLDLVRLPPCRQHRQGRGKGGPRDAIAYRVDVRHSKQVADRVDRIDLRRNI